MTTLASGLMITDAASLKLVLGTEGAAAPGIPAAPAPPAAPGGTWAATGVAAPVGSTLSVSCRMSLMFLSSVAQNLLSEVLRTVVMDPFAPAAAPTPVEPPAPPDPAMLPICEDTPTAPATRRSMFT